MKIMIGAAFVIGSLALPTPIHAADLSSVKRDPNEKICESVIPVGSRLGKKRVCATRAEWEAKRKRDRELVDEAQRRPCFQTESSTGPGGLVCG